jgi:YVTN family beta-propeller protein
LAVAQWLETPVYLPDSLCGALEIRDYTYNSTNDKLYVNGAYVGWVVVIDCATDQRVAKLLIPGVAGPMCYNPDENKVYCASYLPTADSIFVIDGATDSVVAGMPAGHYATAVCYATGSRKMYCTNIDDGTVTAYDGKTNEVVRTVRVGAAPQVLGYNPVFDRLYCANVVSDDITVIDCATDSVIATIDLGYDISDAVMCVNPAGTKLYFSGCGNAIVVIDAATNTVISHVGVGHRPFGLCYNPASNKVYAACRDYHEVLILDGVEDTVVAVLTERYGVEHLCCSPVDNRVYSTNSHRAIDVIDGSGDSLLRSIPVPSVPGPLCYSSASNKVFVINPTTSNVTAIAFDTVVATISAGARVAQTCYNPVEDKLYCPNAEYPEVYVVDCARNLPVATLAFPDIVTTICFNPASNTIYCAGALTRKVYVLDSRRDSVIAVLDAGGYPAQFCYNPHDRKMYCTDSSAKAVNVIDAVDHRVSAVVRVGTDAYSLAYSPTRNVVYCGCDCDSTISVIDGSSDSVVGRVRFCTCGPRVIRYYPGRNRMYAATGCITVFDGLADTVVSLLEPEGYYDDAEVAAEVDKVYFADSYRGRVVAVGGATDSVVAVIPVGGGDWWAASCYDSTNKKLYYVGDAGMVTVIDCTADTVLETFTLRRWPNDVTWCPAHGRMYVGSWRAGCVHVVRDVMVQNVEDGRRTLAGRTPQTTLVQGRTLDVEGRLPALLLDVTGRLAARLGPGSNDISRLPAGIYYLQTATHAKSCKLVRLE